MASLLRSSLLLPPPQPMVVLSFLSLLFFLWPTHSFYLMIFLYLDPNGSNSLYLSILSFSHGSLSLSPKSVCLSLSSLYLSAHWCMLIYGFMGLWCILIWVCGFIRSVVFWFRFLGFWCMFYSDMGLWGIWVFGFRFCVWCFGGVGVWFFGFVHV